MGIAKKARTGDEMWEDLQQNPDFIRRQQERKEETQKRVALIDANARPLHDELLRAGYPADIGYFVNTSEPYPDAIPILLKHIQLPYHPATRIGLARSLITRETKKIANEVLPILLAEFRKETSNELNGPKWAIGYAINYLANDSVYNELAELASDRSHGKARVEIVSALRKMKNPAAVDLLISLLDDDEVVWDAVFALGHLGALKARPYIMRFLSHDNDQVRALVTKAIAKIDKKAAKKSK